MNAQATATRKTTQAQLNEATDHFYWNLDWITGGTREESLRQAPHGIVDLEKKAAIVAALAANPNKVCAANAHLMDRAASIPARLESYRARYCGPDATAAIEEAKRKAAQALELEKLERLFAVNQLIETPSNIISFPSR